MRSSESDGFSPDQRLENVPDDSDEVCGMNDEQSLQVLLVSVETNTVLFLIVRLIIFIQIMMKMLFSDDKRCFYIVLGFNLTSTNTQTTWLEREKCNK